MSFRRTHVFPEVRPGELTRLKESNGSNENPMPLNWSLMFQSPDLPRGMAPEWLRLDVPTLNVIGNKDQYFGAEDPRCFHSLDRQTRFCFSLASAHERKAGFGSDGMLKGGERRESRVPELFVMANSGSRPSMAPKIGVAC